MTYAKNAEKIEVGKQYTMIAPRNHRNKVVPVGTAVTVIAIETLEDAGFEQAEGISAEAFGTIICKMDDGGRIYLGTSNLISDEPIPQTQPVARSANREDYQSRLDSHNAPILEKIIALQHEIVASKDKDQTAAKQREARRLTSQLDRIATVYQHPGEQPTIEQRTIVVLHFSKLGIRRSMEF